MTRSELLAQQAELLKNASSSIKDNQTHVSLEAMGIALICTAMGVILEELADMRKIGERKLDS